MRINASQQIKVFWYMLQTVHIYCYTPGCGKFVYILKIHYKDIMKCRIGVRYASYILSKNRMFCDKRKKKQFKLPPIGGSFNVHDFENTYKILRLHNRYLSSLHNISIFSSGNCYMLYNLQIFCLLISQALIPHLSLKV